MSRSLASNRGLTLALWANAVLLAGVLLVLAGRGGGMLGGNTALAQQAMPPIAGGGGLFFMPGQIDANLYGVYLLDVDRQTLCIYQYFRGGRELQLIAARDIRFDRELRQFNTTPKPDEVAEMLRLERENARINRSGENAARSTAEGAPDGQEGPDGMESPDGPEGADGPATPPAE